MISRRPSVRCRRKARSPFRWQLRWVLPVAVVILLIIGGGGTVVAAANSLPDSPLYRVKLATEAVQLAFTRSDLGKAELYARFADRRVEEIVKMAEKGNTDAGGEGHRADGQPADSHGKFNGARQVQYAGSR